MAGRNARIQTVNNLCKAAAWRPFFYAKYFFVKPCETPFLFPYNCKRKASGTNTSRKAKAPAQRGRKRKRKRLHNAGESESESACTTSRAGRKAARQNVEQTRLTVSGLVTANVQAHGSWVRARTDYARRSASCVKIVDCMNLFRISHASVRA